MSNDLSSSVIMPREDFIELSQVAFDNSHVPSFGERVSSISQAYAIMAGAAGAVVMATWGWTKAIDWLEQKRRDRELALKKFDKQNANTP